MSENQGTELIRYDAMCHAIAEAHAVDEVKDIRDKALAIEVYARQAKNVEAEAKACEIRLRAERRAGELLRDMEKAKAGRPTENPSPSGRDLGGPPLSKLGISYNQSSRWQKLAAIPKDEFDATFGGPSKPSTNGILREHAELLEDAPQQPSADQRREPVRSDGLWLWGRLLDFERNGILDADPGELFANMLDHMQDTTRELTPRVIAWLERLPK